MDDPARMPERAECVVAELLEGWAARRPHHPFLEFEGGAWSFAETLERVQRAAAGLRDLGVRRCDHVLTWMPNRPEAVLAWLAVNYLGAVHVPLNTGYRGRLLQHAIDVTGATLMIVDAALLPRLHEIAPARLRDVVIFGEAPAGAAPAWLRSHGASVLEGPARAAAVRPIEPWEPVYLMLTSGTTGPSKAVVCTYVQAWCGAAMGMDYFGPEDRLLANLPLFHVSGAGAVLDRLTKGGTCVLVDGFSAAGFWTTVRRHRVTGACLVGAMTQYLLSQPARDDDREHTLRNVIAVPWNEDTRAFARRFGLQVHTAFNMTETAVPIRADANPSALGSCGRPRTGIEARIVDAHDLEVAEGCTGELILRAARPWEISPGYHGDAEATAAAWRNGWFHTGDAFRRDAEGHYYFVDRIKDSIRCRGENVSSFEVEAEVLAHPAVLEAAAIAVPGAEAEDEVLVVVTLRDGAVLDPPGLLRFLAPRLAHFMLPRYVRVLEAMPKTPTAKIEKHRLRAEGVTADTWDRAAHGITVRRGGLQGMPATD